MHCIGQTIRMLQIVQSFCRGYIAADLNRDVIVLYLCGGNMENIQEEGWDIDLKKKRFLSSSQRDWGEMGFEHTPKRKYMACCFIFVRKMHPGFLSLMRWDVAMVTVCAASHWRRMLTLLCWFKRSWMPTRPTTPAWVRSVLSVIILYDMWYLYRTSLWLGLEIAPATIQTVAFGRTLWLAAAVFPLNSTAACMIGACHVAAMLQVSTSHHYVQFFVSLWRPLLPYGYSYWKHSVPGQFKPPFVIFDIQALWCSALNVRVPGCQKLQMTA